MATQIKTWEILNGELKPIETTLAQNGRREKEDLEKWIKTHPQILADNVVLIGEQIFTKSGPLDPDEFIPGSILLGVWRPIHLALLFAFTISVFGVFSVLERSTPLVMIAYILGIISCAWSAAVVVLEVFVLPVVAVQSTNQVPLMEMMSLATPYAALGKFFMSAVMVWIFAWILIGIVILRSKLFKRYVGVLIIIASIAIAVPTHFAGGLSGILHVLASLLFGLSWILLGNAIKNQRLNTEI